jgi:hypothetical protein
MHKINCSRIYLNDEIKYQNCDRLQKLFDEANKVIIIREKLIGDLNAQIIEIRSKVQEGETQVKKNSKNKKIMSHI